MCLKLALSSRTFFDDGAFDEKTIQRYKRDLRFFTELRVQAKRDANETVDFSEYEDQIRRLVDKQVIGQEVVDPEGFIHVNTLGQDDNSDDWSDEKTRTEADVIKTRMRKTIEQDLIDDPYAQRVFSELLKEAIEAAEAMFDHPHKQYTMFKDLEAEIADRNTPGVPDRFADQPRAKAYYGLMLDNMNGKDLSEDALVEEALHIETVVIDAIQSHSISPGNLEAAIKKALLVRYFNLLGGTDAAYALIDQVLTVVRAGSAKDGQ